MPTVSVIMPQALIDAVDLAATREGKSRSAALAAAAERWCEVRGMWPPGTDAPVKLPIPHTAVAELLRGLSGFLPQGEINERQCCGKAWDGHASHCTVVAFCERFGIDLSEVERG